MNTLELIDRLCDIVNRQAHIIKEQAFLIEEQLTVDAEVKKKFADNREAITTELDLIEVGLRPLHNTACGKE